MQIAFCNASFRHDFIYCMRGLFKEGTNQNEIRSLRAVSAARFRHTACAFSASATIFAAGASPMEPLEINACPCPPGVKSIAWLPAIGCRNTARRTHEEIVLLAEYDKRQTNGINIRNRKRQRIRQIKFARTEERSNKKPFRAKR